MSSYMRTALAALILGALLPVAFAQPLVVNAEKVWDGERWHTNKRLVILDGKLTAFGPRDAGALPANARVIDLAETWVTPGLVLAHSSTLAPSAADIRSLSPDVIAGDSFDPFAKRMAWDRSGVTHAYLSPGAKRLVPGTGSVALSSGQNPFSAIALTRSAVQAIVTSAAYTPPLRYEAPVPPGPDNPGVRRPQFPKTRAGAFAALRQVFGAADAQRNGKEASHPHWMPELDSIVDVLEGRLPLRARAHRAADIRPLIRLADQYKFRLIIEGGTEAWKLAEDLGRIGAGVVLEVGTPTSGSLEPVAPFRAVRGQRNQDAAAILKRFGVELALVPPTPGAAADLLWYAAQAQTSSEGGFSADAVMASVTSQAASLLGLPKAAGRLTVGVPAHFCVYDRHPLDAAARPVLVYSDGAVVHDQLANPEITAIRAKVLHTASGSPIKNGIVLVRDDKIIEVGDDVVIPPGARVIDVPAVIPGLIDCGGQVALRKVKAVGEGELEAGAAITSQSLSAPLTKIFDPSSNEIRSVAQSGVTSVALVPSGGSAVSGLLSIVKMVPDASEASIVEATSGVLFNFNNAEGSSADMKRLEKPLKAGKKYSDSWDKYDASLAKWKKEQAKKKKKEAEAARKSFKTPTQSPRWDPIVGTWEGFASGPGVPPGGVPSMVQFRREGESIEGLFTIRGFVGKPAKLTAKIANRRLTAKIEVRGNPIVLSLLIERELLTGSWKAQNGSGGSIRLRRVDTATPAFDEAAKKEEAKKKEGEKKKSTDEKKSDAKSKSSSAKPKAKSSGGKPKAPTTNASLEPYRKLFASEIPLFLISNRERFTRGALKILRDEYELIVVLTDSGISSKLMDQLASQGVAFSPSSSTTTRVDGHDIYPALEAVRKKVPVALRSGGKGDSRTLMSKASHAVRSGMSPSDALRCVTRYSALILGQSGRIGMIKPGMDADLVLLTGAPFAAQTRVERVMVNGEFIDEVKGGGSN